MTICWTIAGSDSGGGAGIQADTKTFHGLGVHGCSVLAGLTAQNSTGVTAVEYPTETMIRAQIDALQEDLLPASLKTGMLGNASIMRLVAERIAALKVPYVCDPVMVATSGGTLMEPEARQALVEALLPLAAVVTPNLSEAEVLAEMQIRTQADIPVAAGKILKLGPASVLVKGGHGDTEFSQDYWTNGSRAFWLTNHRIVSANTHGSGCTLAAALTAALGLGYELEDALVVAKAYISQAIRQAKQHGKGPGPVYQGQWPESPGDLPWMTDTAEAGRLRPWFPGTGMEPLGFYPIVDSYQWLSRILPLGVRTVQLRVKDLEGAHLEQEVQDAIRLAREYDCRLFINDYWQLALKHGAYGVHLGQEDLISADLEALAQAGIRLGISTHCYAEVSRALACQPSYLAIGPIFPTTTKEMRFGPQGLEALQRWRRSLRYPLVGIGGISFERASSVLHAGADAVAVITAITQAEDPEGEVRRWLAHCENALSSR